MKLVLHYGYLPGGGHVLQRADGVLVDPGEAARLPWAEALLDGGLLVNRRVHDAPDGRVFWTAGGRPHWYAFFWWDRSGDPRGGSNSAFLVRGFDHDRQILAFNHACRVWPHVVARQRHPLVLQP